MQSVFDLSKYIGIPIRRHDNCREFTKFENVGPHDEYCSEYATLRRRGIQLHSTGIHRRLKDASYAIQNPRSQGIRNVSTSLKSTLHAALKRLPSSDSSWANAIEESRLIPVTISVMTHGRQSATIENRWQETEHPAFIQPDDIPITLKANIQRLNPFGMRID